MGERSGRAKGDFLGLGFRVVAFRVWEKVWQGCGWFRVYGLQFRIVVFRIWARGLVGLRVGFRVWAKRLVGPRVVEGCRYRLGD